MTNNIKEALINNNVDVKSLIEQLCTISAVKSKNVPLFDKDVFKRIKSIYDFWRELRSFWNIFDYEILRIVIDISDCKEAQVILDKFLSRTDPSSIKDEDLVLCCNLMSSRLIILSLNFTDRSIVLQISTTPIQNTSENDLHELRGNDYGYNEGTIRYKELPSCNNIFTHVSFFLCFILSHTFSWACGSLHEPPKFFSFKLSVTQSILMYHSVLKVKKIVGLSFSKLSFKVVFAYMLL